MNDRSQATKKIWVLSGLCLLLIVFVLVSFSESVTKNKTSRPALVLKTEAELALLQGDRDANGDPDWKDLILSGTSPEIKEKANSFVVSPELQTSLNDPNNITASLSKNLYTISTYANQKNISKEEETAIVESILQKEYSKIIPKTYSLEEIVVSESTNKEYIRYGNALAIILNKANAYDLGVDYLSVLKEYSETKDNNLLVFFAVKKNQVGEIIDAMLKISVPSSLALYHLEIINSLSLLQSLLSAFETSDKDPVRSLVAFNSYFDVTKRLIVSVDRLQTFFREEKIPFTQKDTGYIFIKQN